MDSFYLAVALYLAVNTVLCVLTLWVGIVSNGERISGLGLLVMMAVLILFGMPLLTYVALEK